MYRCEKRIKTNHTTLDMDIIGVDVGGTKIGAGTVSGGKIEDHKVVDISPGSREEVTEQLLGAVESLFASTVDGIGIGIPGAIDQETGTVLKCPNVPSTPLWENIPLKKIVEEKFGVPMKMNNDANCFALGEKYFGQGKGYKNVVGLIIGTGCGAGIIADGRLVEGANCGAGEFGQIPFGEGVMEYWTSAQFFKRKYGITGKEAFDLAESGGSKALEMFEEYGANLGRLLVIIRHAVDPEIVVLGGSVSKAFKYFEKPMREALKASPFAQAWKPLVVEPSSLEHVYVLGAAALFMQ